MQMSCPARPGSLPWQNRAPEARAVLRQEWWWVAVVGGPRGCEGRLLPPDLQSVLGSELLTRAFCPKETSVVNPPSSYVLSTFCFVFFCNTFAFWLLLWRNVPTAGTQERAPGWRNRCPLECLSQVLWDLTEKHLSSPAPLCGLIKAFWAELAVLPLSAAELSAPRPCLRSTVISGVCPGIGAHLSFCCYQLKHASTHNISLMKLCILHKPNSFKTMWVPYLFNYLVFQQGPSTCLQDGLFTQEMPVLNRVLILKTATVQLWCSAPSI